MTSSADGAAKSAGDRSGLRDDPRPTGRERRRGRACVVSEFKMSVLASAEGNDAADWIVGGDADRDPVAGDDLDAKTPHATTELGEHFVPGIALNPVESTAMDR